MDDAEFVCSRPTATRRGSGGNSPFRRSRSLYTQLFSRGFSTENLKTGVAENQYSLGEMFYPTEREQQQERMKYRRIWTVAMTYAATVFVLFFLRC